MLIVSTAQRYKLFLNRQRNRRENCEASQISRLLVKKNSATDALSHRPSNLCTWCNGTPVLLLFSILYFFYLSFCRHYCYNCLIHSSLRSDDKRCRVDTLCILLTTSGRERKISRRKRNLLRRKKIFSRRESDGRSCRHPAFCRHAITCSVSV